jgi:hypothetical protein
MPASRGAETLAGSSLKLARHQDLFPVGSLECLGDERQRQGRIDRSSDAVQEGVQARLPDEDVPDRAGREPDRHVDDEAHRLQDQPEREQLQRDRPPPTVSFVLNDVASSGTTPVASSSTSAGRLSRGPSRAAPS